MSSHKPAKEADKSKLKVKGICPSCHKSIRQLREGSFTSWLLGSVSCTCDLPQESAILLAQEDAAVHRTAAIDDHLPTELPDLGDRYEVIEQVGHGGMGFVYKVKDKELGKTFAIKLLRHELARDKDAVKRFKQEAEAAASLTHANLGTVYTHGQARDGAPYLVMDFLDGASLAAEIKDKGKLDCTRALDIFIQVCEGLEHAHAKGVIHRDLKPSNIILSKSPDGHDLVHLVDFGIAKVLSKPGETLTSLTQTGDLFGSPLYMSPEQCEGGSIDARSDIYSLGCVLYESFVGEPPFAGNNPFKVMMKQVSTPPPDIVSPDVPQNLRDLIHCCLSKDSSLRYDNVLDLRLDLLDIAQHKPPRSLPKLLKKRPVETKGVKQTLARPSQISTFWMQTVIVLTFVVACILLPGMFFFSPAQQEMALRSANLSDIRAQAVQHFNARDYKGAIPLFEMCVYGHRNEIEDFQLAFLLQRLGECFEATGETDKALLAYEDACRICRDFGVSANSEPMFLKHANLLRKLNRFEEAAKLEKEAVAAKVDLARLRKEHPGRYIFDKK